MQMEEDLEECGSGRDCKNERSIEPHACPYQEDANNDKDYKCYCCDSCAKKCFDDN